MAESTGSGKRERDHRTRMTGPASVSASSSGEPGCALVPALSGSRMRSTERPRQPAAVRRRGASMEGRCACAVRREEKSASYRRRGAGGTGGARAVSAAMTFGMGVAAADLEVDAEAEEEADVVLRMDARSDGGGGAARREGGDETVVVIVWGGRAGSFGGWRRAMAFSQSCEMRAEVVGLAKAAEADNSTKDSAELPVVCSIVCCAALGLGLGDRSDRDTEWKDEMEESWVWLRGEERSSDRAGGYVCSTVNESPRRVGGGSTGLSFFTGSDAEDETDFNDVSDGFRGGNGGAFTLEGFGGEK